MRIAHFTDASIDGVNGIASSIRLLVQVLTRRGHDCVVISPGPPWRAGTHERDGVFWMPSLSTGMGDFRFTFLPIRGMRDRVRAWRPDIAHVHTPGPLGAAALSVAGQLGTPAVYTYHTDMHGYAEHYYIPVPVIRAGTAWYGRHLRPDPTAGTAGRYEAVEAANARIFNAARVIIAPTANALRRCRTSAFAGKVRVVATPAHLPPAATTGAAFRSRYGIAPDAAVVLFVGRLAREKGIRLLVGAFAALCDKVPKATLLLVGPRTRRLRLRRLLDRAGVTARTVVTGPLPGAQVQAAYQAATVFAFPSSTDTQGIVLHEAALAGLPIVMTDRQLHGSHPLSAAMRVTDPTPAAVATAISALLRAPADAKLLAEHGSLLARAQTPDRFADEIMHAYEAARTP